MIPLRNFLHRQLIFHCVFLLIFFSSSFRILAVEIDWLEVSRTNNELLYINPNSIKYSNKGFLSVIAKQSEIDPDDQTLINENPFITASRLEISQYLLVRFLNLDNPMSCHS